MLKVGFIISPMLKRFDFRYIVKKALYLVYFYIKKKLLQIDGVGRNMMYRYILKGARFLEKNKVFRFNLIIISNFAEIADNEIFDAE